MTAEKVVQSFRDPAFLKELRALPIENQFGVQQEALGELIIDPDFQAVFNERPDEAVQLITDFANQHFPVPLQGIPPSDERLQSPEEGQSLAANLVNPGVLLSPENLAAGVGAGLSIGKGVVGSIREGARGFAEAGLGATALVGPVRRGVQAGVRGFREAAPAVGSAARTAERTAATAVPEGTATLPEVDLPTTRNNLGIVEGQEPPVTQADDGVFELQATRNVTPQEPAQPSGQLFEGQTISTEVTGEVVKAAKADVQQMVRRAANSPKDVRLFKQVGDALEAGEIDVDSLPRVLQKFDLNTAEFVTAYKETISQAGRKLQQLSSLRRQMNALGKTNPEMQQALDVLDQEVQKDFPTIWTRFLYGSNSRIPGTDVRVWPGWFAVDNARRGIIVTQLATTMRNIWSQAGRYSLEAFDQAIQGQVGGKGLGNAPELVANMMSSLKSKASREALADRVSKTLDAFPLEEAKILAQPAGEVTLGTKVAKVLNTLNTMQEQFFRRTAFDGTLRGELRQADLNVEEALANPSSIPEDIIKRSVQTALEATFVASPKQGTFGNAVAKAYAAFPPLTTINPFPRFWANAIKFLTEFNPAGYAKLITRKDFLSKNPQERAKVISRATLGTGLLAGAFALRANENTRGAKWYQVKVGDQNIDTRAFAPFSTFLFMADIIDVMSQTGVDVVKDGQTLAQALQNRWNYTTADLVQATLGINRISGTGLVAVDLVREGSLDRKMDLLRDLFAQYVGSFTVPFRSIKDIVGGTAQAVGEATGNEELAEFGRQEQLPRDIRQSPTVGPAAQNLPGSSLLLPQRNSPIESDPQPGQLGGIPSGLIRQFTGLSPRPATVIGEEIDRLGIEFSRVVARTGDPAANNAVHAFMAPALEQTLAPIIEHPNFQRLQPAARKFVVQSIIQLIRRNATKALKEQNPELGAKLQLDRISKSTVDLITGLTGIDMKELLD